MIFRSCRGGFASSTFRRGRRSCCNPSLLLRLFSTKLVFDDDDDDDTQLLFVSPNQWAASRCSATDPLENRIHPPFVHHEHYSFPDWPKDHTFPMDKFAKIAEALMTTCQTTVPDSTLSKPLVRDDTDFFRPWDRIPRSWISGPIDATFLDRFLNAQLTKEECRIIGFREQTHRYELIRRTILEVAGTILTCQLASVYGIAAHTAGGTHHAHPTMGAGYTILNDLAIATHVLVHDLLPTTTSSLNNNHNKTIRRVLVIDCDVHQGDGTAQFGGHSSVNHGGTNKAEPLLLQDRLFTLSIHCASNYPRIKANSTFDVGVPDGIGDEEYMDILQSSVNHALTTIDPDFVIYDAGVDVYEHDRLGRLNLSENGGIRQRDRWVLERCVTAGIPVAAVIGGGYDTDVRALARRHAIVHEEAAHIWQKYQMWNRKSIT